MKFDCQDCIWESRSAAVAELGRCRHSRFMKMRASLLIAVLLGLLCVGCSKHATGPNQVLFDYLGNPVAPPANMDAAYTKGGLTSAMQEAAQAANITLTKVEVDDSEFPFLVGVVCANKGDWEKLKEQIRKMTAHNYTGGIGGDTKMVMNLVPYSAFPTDAHERIHHRMMLREAVFYDKITGHQ
jgi:uncharacterized protein YgfB (UPF0149 family)